MADHLAKVLLIDDDEDDYVIIRDLLTSLETSTIVLDWVGTYDEGLEATKLNAHDVYLLDYRLGERSGLDFLRQARADGCEAPIILLTGQGDYDLDVTAMKAGAADYLVKGQVDGALLDRSIRYALERHRSETNAEKTETTTRPGDLLLQIALARGSSVRDAAQAAGISERTAHRRLGESRFRAEVEELRQELRSKLVDEVALQLLTEESMSASPSSDDRATSGS